jgi:hypothetical protein
MARLLGADEEKAPAAGGNPDYGSGAEAGDGEIHRSRSPASAGEAVAPGVTRQIHRDVK